VSQLAEIMAMWPKARVLGDMSFMVDPDAREIRAIELCSEPAGEYIETLASTDMATWSEEEWYCFLEVVVTGYLDGLISRQNEHRLMA
jgi:hypothetical protein